MRPRSRVLVLLLAGASLIAGCAVRDFVLEVPERINQATKPVKYTLARESTGRRDNFEQARAQLDAGDLVLAQRSLHRALWDLEQIEGRWLRLEELVEALQVLAEIYRGLDRAAWADEQRALARALTHARRRDDWPVMPRESLTKGKGAYQAARFREATVALRQALVDLQVLAHTPARVASLEEARCYLALAHFALDQHDRAREELRRLAALDESVTTCRREAPPAVRALIRDVQLTEVPALRRSMP
jgi:tetratricopeptide (TPR) repeat protein